MPDGDIDRLAELIWSTVKLRWTLLLLAVLSLLIVWSSLENGNKNAPETDKKFCAILALDIHLQNPETFCVADPEENRARVVIEEIRNGISALPSAYQNPSGLLQTIRMYDDDRLSKYQLALKFSSGPAEGSVEVNALLVAKVAPFIALVLIAAVVILGFQEKYYKNELTRLLKIANREELPLALARSQFLSDFSCAVVKENGRRFRRGPMVAPAPETLILGALYFGFIYSLAILLRDFWDNVVHLTDSVFFNYAFAFYAAVFLTVWLLLNTWRAYRLFPEPPERTSMKAESQASRVFRLPWLRVAVAATGLASFGLPWLMRLEGDLWTWPPNVHAYLLSNGYHFLTHQKPLLDNFGRPILISPRTFGEIRLQLWIAIIFLIVCTLDAAGLSRKAPVLGSLLRKASIWMSRGIFFLSLNYWVYMCVLWYQLTLGVPWPLVAPDFKGVSMINFAPAYGFWIFTCCCALLITSSLRSDREPIVEQGVDAALVMPEKSEA
jgi:hypothetical protein